MNGLLNRPVSPTLKQEVSAMLLTRMTRITTALHPIKLDERLVHITAHYLLLIYKNYHTDKDNRKKNAIYQPVTILIWE